jgi:hypothetical protein
MARQSSVRFFTDYEDQSVESDELVIPENLDELPLDEITELHSRAIAAFKTLYGDGKGFSPDEVDTLKSLKVGITALNARKSALEADSASLSSEASALAAEVGLEFSTEETEEVTEEEADVEETEEVEEEITAGAREIRVPMASIRGRKQPALPETKSMRDIAFAPNGDGLDKMDMARSIDKRLRSFNSQAYAAAAKSGKQVSESFAIATINRDFPSELRVTNEDADAAITAAINESNLPGGSLVASGGWCAPSETMYDLCNLSEAANLISLPEINISRGGIKWTKGPDYQTIFGATGFCFSEADDIANDYQPGLPGTTKPCYHVQCATFEEKRLGACGICITAGLLQQKGYPELIADTIDIALNAHAHRVSASVINTMVTESTAVTLPSPQSGAAAPLLTAIDLQATHYRAINRMSDTATLEVVLPTWTRALLRADLARRQGVDLLDVPDTRVAGWFSARNVNPQYVVDWQDVATTAASGFTAFATTVKFLLYAAGTFVKGSTDSITLENVYDSVGLGTNDYTALFTEDPFLVAKRCQDSRVVTVPVCPNGSTAIGVAISCSGTGA